MAIMFTYDKKSLLACWQQYADSLTAYDNSNDVYMSRNASSKLTILWEVGKVLPPLRAERTSYPLLYVCLHMLFH